jgi:uncharacterized protein
MDTDLERILREAKTVAVVGLSPKPDRPSFRVASYLQREGYRVIPVNPAVEEVLGERSYPNLQAVPDKIDVVDIFRRSEEVPPIVDEAIEVSAPVVWMQEGVINEDAAARAEQAGLKVVMNRCMQKEHRRLLGQ